MKSFRIDDDDATSLEKCRIAVHQPTKGKKDRPDVKRILDNDTEAAKKIHDIVVNRKYKSKKHEPCLIYEYGSGKMRKIIKPDYMPEQIIHHVVVNAIQEDLKSGMYKYNCASIPGRGAHYGKRAVERWLKTDVQNTKIVCKMDIRHFFQNVDHDILKETFKKKFRPGLIRDLALQFIDDVDEGLPLGYYTSQWFANFLLQPLDHYIKETLRVKYYIRYMDDMVIFGSNKKQVHAWLRSIEEFLGRKLNLKLKRNWQVFRLAYAQNEYCITCRKLHNLLKLDKVLTQNNIKHKCKMYKGKRRIFIIESNFVYNNDKIIRLLQKYGATKKQVKMVHGRPLDFMGFQFYRHKTLIRKSIMLRLTRKARQIGTHDIIPWKQAAAMLSYVGWIDHTKSYQMYLKKVKPFVNFRRLKRIVSKHQRRLNDELKLREYIRNSRGKALNAG